MADCAAMWPMALSWKKTLKMAGAFPRRGLCLTWVTYPNLWNTFQTADSVMFTRPVGVNCTSTTLQASCSSACGRGRVGHAKEEGGEKEGDAYPFELDFLAVEGECGVVFLHGVGLVAGLEPNDAVAMRQNVGFLLPREAKQKKKESGSIA
mmetsp:Transcript_10723/g.26921  ORF Transcript_10723/g.26921 Transcript_10723/m.26921 type:complete len:151 (+) Transcript_10723:95-547(+)